MDAAISRTAQDIETLWRQTYRGQWDRPASDGRVLSTAQRQSVRSRVLSLWEQAPNWHTLLELNRRYLERKLPVCASYGQPPDAETDQFTNLLRLHDYGLLSTNSCPGWAQQRHRQRSFLYFSLPTQGLATVANKSHTEAILGFVNRLLEAQDVYAHVRFQYHRPPSGVQRDQSLESLFPYGARDNLSIQDKDWDVDLDDNNDFRGFIFVNDQIYHNASWETFGHCRIEASSSAFCYEASGRHFLASRAADPLQISVVARNWDYRNVGGLIERLLHQAGIIPGFRRQI